jgi:hypothetical protein
VIVHGRKNNVSISLSTVGDFVIKVLKKTTNSWKDSGKVSPNKRNE